MSIRVKKQKLVTGKFKRLKAHSSMVSLCLHHNKHTKNFKSVGMTLAKVKEQDGMTLAK